MTSVITAGNTATHSLRGEDVINMVARNLSTQGVASQVTTFFISPGGSHAFYIPILTKDPAAMWTAEGEEIVTESAQFGEDGDYYQKIASIQRLSREFVNDMLNADWNGDSQKMDVFISGFTRDMTRKIDKAFFGTRGSAGTYGRFKAPRGLKDLSDVSTITVRGGINNADPFHEAIIKASKNEGVLTHFVAHPDDALTLLKLKESTTSNRELLDGQTVAGLPVLVTPAVDKGTIWGIPKDNCYYALRQDAEVQRSESAFFSTDEIAVKAICRMTFAYSNPAAIQKITIS